MSHITIYNIGNNTVFKIKGDNYEIRKLGILK